MDQRDISSFYSVIFSLTLNESVVALLALDLGTLLAFTPDSFQKDCYKVSDAFE